MRPKMCRGCGREMHPAQKHISIAVKEMDYDRNRRARSPEYEDLAEIVFCFQCFRQQAGEEYMEMLEYDHRDKMYRDDRMTYRHSGRYLFDERAGARRERVRDPNSMHWLDDVKKDWDK